ncbi:MAG TPA: TA system VapC family ribonuclease toxin [Actinomycetales bacterium]|nr:TA system VapC family ribonuclease toxin [Actinomycetales bacterium]
MLVDANLLLYAVDRSSPFHQKARPWWQERLNGSRQVGLPWPTIGAFVRISTHPRASARPLTVDQAWGYVAGWLAQPVTWTPTETDQHAEVLGELLLRHRVRGNLVTDAQLVALAICHGLAIVSADTDFARFSEVTWTNPLAS